jgi:hypothetical protein
MRVRKRNMSSAKARKMALPGATGKMAPHRRAKAIPGPTIMRQSTWESMPKGKRMREHGTTSYAKYKADKLKMSARGKKRQQGGGGGSDQKAGPGGYGGGTKGDPMM